MNNIISPANYDKFIFKGSLALESYFDATNQNKEIFDNFNKKLKEYRSLLVKTEHDKKNIVDNLLTVFDKIGKENFIMYEDGDVEYNYEIKKDMN